MLEGTNAITNEFLEPMTYVVAYPNVFASFMRIADSMRILYKTSLLTESQALLKCIYG